MSTIFASLAVIATSRFVWRQTTLANASASNDQLAFIRQSIHHVACEMQREDFRAVRQQLFQKGPLPEYRKMSSQAKEDARAILSVYGPLCQMIDRGALEERAFWDYWRSAFMRDWERLKPFVDAEREAMKNKTLFELTEKLAGKWARQGLRA